MTRPPPSDQPDNGAVEPWAGRRRRTLVRLSIALVPVVLIVTLMWAADRSLGLRVSRYGITSTSRDVASSYLSEMKSGKYDRALDRRCLGPEERAPLVEQLARARARGHGVKSFHLRPGFTKETLNLTSARGWVSFQDGEVQQVEYEYTPDHCLVAYDDLG